MHKKLLLVIILAAFFIRLLNLEFPAFTADEARIAYRGYTLSKTFNDELGRPHPLVFNSLIDYQLPVTSYLTALGVFIFGKSDLGARIPFILIGTVLVLMVYKIGILITQKRTLGILAALLTAFSPVLIFLSKIPNETIVLALLFCLLYYFLTKERMKALDILVIILAALGAVLTSKYSWFILGPFVWLTLIAYQTNLDIKRKFIITSSVFLISIFSLLIFLQVPQSKRSLEENNFSIFNNMTIQNGISKLRGQGMESGWPGLIDKILFNKSQFALVGLMHWSSNLSPSIHFGEFDSKGEVGFLGVGAWAKILIIPAGLGIIFLIKKGRRAQKLLLLYPLFLTWPALFNYPDVTLGLVALTFPFIAILIALGFNYLNKKITLLIIALMILEIVVNLFYLPLHQKSSQEFRPSWIKALALDINDSKKIKLTAVSDDINMDMTPLITWYTVSDPKEGYLNIDWAYKFRQTSLNNFKTIGADGSFFECNQNTQLALFVSERDMKKIDEIEFNSRKSYKDDRGKDKAFLLSDGVCIK